MIAFEDVTFTYADADAPTLWSVDLRVAEGELCLVVGPTGAGKSTLLRLASGLAPHFTGGTLGGHVRVDGRDTRDHRPRDLADVVGVVLQHPASGFVTNVVEDELAYGMEQLALPPTTMRRRVDEVLGLLGLAELRDRPLHTLSGGEQQRVAIGAVLTAHPRVLVLDEPTSALDPAAADDVLATLTRLVHDLGMTVLLAEHRIERVVHYADRLVVVAEDGTVADGEPAQVLATDVAGTVAPPIVELGRLAGWSPLPLSVRDARRRAAPLRERLHVPPPAPRPATGSPALLRADDVHVRYGRTPAVRGVSLTVHAGEVVAVMGRNGAGKSSLLWALEGSLPTSAGRVERPRTAGRPVALVPQEPQQLLYLPTVAAECGAADRAGRLVPGTTAARLAAIVDDVPPDAHPRDLSEGQRLALVLAVQTATEPPVVLLDEPTRGLDYASKERLTGILRARAAAGGAVVLSTHDVEFAAETADRVVLLADGVVVGEGPARDVLTASPTFAPQVAKILAPAPVLTVAEARGLLAAGA